LYVRGADVDLRALAGAGGYAPVPGAHWRPQRFWTSARPSSGSAGMPGARVTLPGGRTAFSVAAETVPSVEALVETTVAAVSPGARVIAVESHGTLPASGELSTLVSRSLGGLQVEVHAVDGEVLTPVGEAFALAPGLGEAAGDDAATGAHGAVGTAGAGAAGTAGAGGVGSAGTAASAAGTAAAGTAPTTAATDPAAGDPAPATAPGDDRWTPGSGESVRDRLRGIVAESMGYDPEDLPGELALTDLGLDSLMGMRIKNRVEYDFALPPVPVQTLRDSSLDDVVRLVEEQVADRVAAAGEGDPVAAAGSTAPGVDADATPTDASTPAAATPDAPTATATDPTAHQGVGIPPRDASERLVFATWAGVTGVAAAGVTSALPEVDEPTAQAVAERLNERSGSSISSADVLAARTLEPLADAVREHLESEVEGTVREFRPRPAGSTAPAVILFHPAGGSSVVYGPLARRLPADVPVYGIERLEGSLDERAAVYVDEVRRLADGHPVILGGWSFGGALALEVAVGLAGTGVDVAHVELLDLVRPEHPAPDTAEEMHARWDRYAAFAAKTYGIDLPVPHDLLDEYGEQVMMDMFTQFMSSSDAADHGVSVGVLEHQRASFVDTRVLNQLDFHRWSGVTAPVTLFRSEGMHEGAVELEPAFATIAADGGWGGVLRDLETVQLRGDHLAVVDEPEISTVGAVVTRHIREVTAAAGAGTGTGTGAPADAPADAPAPGRHRRDGDAGEATDQAAGRESGRDDRKDGQQ
ncbi:thioesterase domain-containing protein, partial [Corynebacterium bovis]